MNTSNAETHKTEAPTVLDLARAEVQRQIDLGQEIIAIVLDTPGLFSEDEKYPGITRQWLEELRRTFEIEGEKIEANEATIAVVGTMKAGKSTAINAIVGFEVVPSRDQPMTTFPTRVVHVPGLLEPELTFPLTKGFEALAAAIQRETTGSGSTADDKKEMIDPWMERLSRAPQKAALEKLLTEVRRGQLHFASEAKGREAIQKLLCNVNDLTRLASVLSIDLSIATPKRLGYEEVPTIRIEFEHLAGTAINANNKLALVDTPGPNEQGNNRHLAEMITRQLAEASGIVMVVDYTGFGNEAAAGIEDMVGALPPGQAERLFVMMNKFDQRGVDSLSEDEVRNIIFNRFKDRWRHLPDVFRSRIYPTSARYALRASQMRRKLRNAQAIDPKEDKWADEFLGRAYGETWMDEPEILQDTTELGRRADRMWRNTKFQTPLDEAIAESARNAALIVVISALEKLRSQTAPLLEMLGVREGAFQKNIDQLRTLIIEFSNDIKDLTKCIENAQQIVEQEVREIKPIILAEVEKISDDLSAAINAYLRNGVVPPEPEIEKHLSFINAVDVLRNLMNLMAHKREIRQMEKIEEKRRKEEKNNRKNGESLTAKWYLVNHPDTGEKCLRAHSQSEAAAMADEIFDEVQTILDFRVEMLNDIVIAHFDVASQQTRARVLDLFSRKWAKIEQQLKKITDVSVEAPEPKFELDFTFDPSNRKKGTHTHMETQTGVRDVDGEWYKRSAAKVLNLFRSEPLTWGRESYTYTKYQYFVDLGNIRQQVQVRIGRTANQAEHIINKGIDELQENISEYGSKVRRKVESVHRYLIEEVRDREDQASAYNDRREIVLRLAAQTRDLISEANSVSTAVKEMRNG